MKTELGAGRTGSLSSRYSLSGDKWFGLFRAAGLVLLLAFTSGARADSTYVSGPITANTVWDTTHSPYVVVGSVVVMDSITLTIGPGVVVAFDSLKALEVRGTLIARGTNARRITFTARPPARRPGWLGYVLFNDASEDAEFDSAGRYLRGCILECCDIKFGGGARVSNNGTVRTENAHPFLNYCRIDSSAAAGMNLHNSDGTVRISHSTVRWCRGDGVRSGWDYSTGGGLVVRACEFSDNDSSGMTAVTDFPVVVDSTVVERNARSARASGSLSIYTRTAGSLLLTNSVIRDNTEAGLAVSGGTAVVRNCNISGNSAWRAAGVYLGRASGVLDNCRICHNTASSYFGGLWILGDTVSVTNSIISHNLALGQGGWEGNGGGMHVDEAAPGPASLSISNSIVSDNYATGRGGGIATSLYYGAAVGLNLARTVIADNRAGGVGGGVYAKGLVACSTSTVCRNSAHDCYGIYLTGVTGRLVNNTVTANHRIVGSPDTTSAIAVSGAPVLTRNNICLNDTVIELYNGNAQGSPDLSAENNWWGTAVESLIQRKIYDWFDNGSLGIVDYRPFQTAIRTDAPISPPTGLVAEHLVDSIVVAWSANAESDLAGYIVYWDTTSEWPYAHAVDVGNVRSCVLRGIAPREYYVTVTAYDRDYDPAHNDTLTIVNDNQTAGNESWYAQGVTASPPVSVDGRSPLVLPREVELAGALPNPLRQTTEIVYALPVRTHAKLSICDIAGREVVKLADAEVPAGRHEAHLDASALPNGVYFCRLQAARETRTAKLVVQR